MRDVYIVSAVRTPIGRFGGKLIKQSPVDLGAHAMKAAIERAGIAGDNLDRYIFGNVLRAGHGQLIPRQAAFKAGLPADVDGYAIDMVCSSGMMSIMNAATAIKAGEADLVMAGGIESMSQAGFTLSHNARWGYKFLAGNNEGLTDVLKYDGLTDPFTGDAMGLQTEKLAAERGITREALDAVAALSHQRAQEAREKGWLTSEIAPIELKSRKGSEIFDYDEGVRSGTTAESLAGLRPAFKKDGVLTAANSSQISDGAAALIIASKDAIEKYGLTPIAKITGSAISAGEPYKFPEAPIPAVKRICDQIGVNVGDFDAFENNEAFALNNLLFVDQLGVSEDKLNVFGGAIAMGHPIGCSGARIIVTLLNVLQQKDGHLGMASICHGTGGGTALSIERV